MAEPSRTGLSPASALWRMLLLTATAWVGAGFLGAILILWYLERGLTVPQALAVGSVTGLAVCCLELPTSGFADAFGRRPVYVASAVVRIAALAAIAVADGWTGFAVAAALTGAYRALDSGPLEAWYVDAVHESDPGADVDRGLARQGTVMGATIAAGALLTGALVAWHPFSSRSALELPILVATALAAVHLAAVLLLMREAPGHGSSWSRAATSAAQTPRVIADGLRLLRANGVLRATILVEVFWVLAMVVFESLQPVRLAELVGGEEAAGALAGPVTAGGWVVYAAGSALAGWVSPRLGVARTAMLGRVANGVGAMIMGLTLGPVGLIAAFLVTYAMHGFAGPMHATLLHREASAGNRATVLSINSMLFFAAFGVAAPLLGLVAQASSTQVAMVLGGALSIGGVLLYLPALRAERAKGVSVGDSPGPPAPH